ncbi:MAG: YqeG family HAD IIIA-type phosphatase [Synechococcaceae cyanobacterium RM1_1_27]|nr:YqeG family HAD IIIA-type phosphatase [Synechococcaceae cyanobacterium RM1_1_27]
MIFKSWIKLLQPDIVVAGTVLNLMPEMLIERGIQGIIFDVDNTLVPIQEEMAAPEIEVWLQPVREQFQVWLVSNNLDMGRIRKIAEQIEIRYISRAAKPSRRALRQVIEHMSLPPERVAIVGDRLLTDMLAGNRLGLLTVLVKPLVSIQRDPVAEGLELVAALPIESVEVEHPEMDPNAH